MTPEQDEAVRHGSYYLMLADGCDGKIPYSAALFRFASKQLGEYIKDGQVWHVRAANAAAHDAQTIANNVAARWN